MSAVCQMTPSYHPFGDWQDYGLTARERQVIALVSAGYPTRGLAQELGISQNNVKNHITHVYDKLGVSNRVELVLFALAQGLLVTADNE